MPNRNAMIRTAIIRSEPKKTVRPFAFDALGTVFYVVHLAIISYVSLAWLIPSRMALYVYTLILPLTAAQWILNGGVSIVNNIENLLRVGRWNDPENVFEGAFFKLLFNAIGVSATQAQITTMLCFLMLMFWLGAVCKMILIVAPQP